MSVEDRGQERRAEIDLHLSRHQRWDTYLKKVSWVGSGSLVTEMNRQVII